MSNHQGNKDQDLEARMRLFVNLLIDRYLEENKNGDLKLINTNTKVEVNNGKR